MREPTPATAAARLRSDSGVRMLGTLTAPNRASHEVVPSQSLPRRAALRTMPLSLPLCLPRTPPDRAVAPPPLPGLRRPPAPAVPARFIENPYLRFFLTSITYIRGSQTSRRGHVVLCLLTKSTRI